MKKLIYVFLVISCFGFIINVSAKEVYYKNDNDVLLTKEEYEFISYMFWDGAQDLMTQEDYSKFIESNIINGELGSNIYYQTSTRATTVNDANRTLKIVKSCSTTCFISVTLTWKNSPAVRSYEVIGAYLSGTSLSNTPTTTVTSTSGTTNSNNIKNFSNGFGVSIALPTYGESLVVNQTFRVATGGTVYASYQHAMKTISLSNSQNYSLSRTGYGGVFSFSGTAASTYDRMNGVSISL